VDFKKIIKMKIEKKHIIAGVIGVTTTVALAYLYLQFKKLKSTKICFKGLKVKSISGKDVNFDVFLNVNNSSDAKIEIVSQNYDLYLNNKFITKVSNNAPSVIQANADSLLGVNVSFNPSDVLKVIGQSALAMITQPETVKVKLDIKLKVKFFGFKISLPIVVEKSIKDLIDAQKAPKEPKSGKC
jgi:LEA14-like dessication related protein